MLRASHIFLGELPNFAALCSPRLQPRLDHRAQPAKRGAVTLVERTHHATTGDLVSALADPLDQAALASARGAVHHNGARRARRNSSAKLVPQGVALGSSTDKGDLAHSHRAHEERRRHRRRTGISLPALWPSIVGSTLRCRRALPCVARAQAPATRDAGWRCAATACQHRVGGRRSTRRRRSRVGTGRSRGRGCANLPGSARAPCRAASRLPPAHFARGRRCVGAHGSGRSRRVCIAGAASRLRRGRERTPEYSPV